MMRLSLHFVLIAMYLLLCVNPAHSETQPPMLHYRTGHFAFPFGNSQVLIVGGSQLHTNGGGEILPSTAVELYDYRAPGKALASVPFEVLKAIQLSNGSVLACSDSDSKKCAIFSASANLWQQFDWPPELGYGPFLVALPDSSALIGGGVIGIGSRYSHAAYTLDPSLLSWRRAGDNTHNWQSYDGVTLTDGRAFFLRGFNTEIFNPATGQWKTAAPIPDSTGGLFSRLALPGNKVLALSYFSAGYIYDATSDKWRTVPELQIQNGQPKGTMILLPNGQVLIAGGSQNLTDTETVIQTTLLFDPQSGVVRQGAPLAVPRTGYAAVVLPNGEVLLTGGIMQWFPFQLQPGSYTPVSLTNSVESYPWEPAFRGTLDPGYYIATASQAPLGKGGFWGIEVRTSGRLDGGLNYGGFLDWQDLEIGFGAFYIDSQQTVSVEVKLQRVPMYYGWEHLPASVSILDASKKLVAGPVQGDGHLELSQALQPGFYSVEIHSAPEQSSPAAFQISLSAPQLQGGGSAGSLISRWAGVDGFVGFYLSTRQDVEIKLCNQNTYGFSRGAGEVILGLKDSSGKVLFKAGPGAMN